MGLLTGGFASLAARALSSVYVAGEVIDQAATTTDDGGSIVPGGAPMRRPCRVQIDRADWAMQQQAGYVAGSMRVLILADTLTGTLNTDARLRVREGPHTGMWLVTGLSLDAAGSYWAGQGKRA